MVQAENYVPVQTPKRLTFTQIENLVEHSDVNPLS